jgi:uncharacterized protein (TIGR00369 family)
MIVIHSSGAALRLGEEEMDPATDTTQRTGLDHVRAIFSAGGSARGIGKTMRFKGTSANEGVVVLEGLPDEDFYNPLGAVHGGYAATILDAAMGLAVHTTIPRDSAYSTIDLNVTYLKPLRADCSPVIAEGRAIHVGRRIVACEARLTDRQGRLCARATATYMIAARADAA